jgi:D-inositol-3-phosphate glycosyltransferase
MTQRRGWPDGLVRAIPNPISQTLINAASAFHRNGNHERIVLYAGRLAPVKGIETLLDAAKLVQEIDPSIKFVLAGPWQMPKPPETFGLQASQSNGIQWLGPQNQTALIDLYQRVAVVVVPSNYESFGLTAVEAMAFGVPTVATDAGALREVVGPTNLVPRNDPQSLSTAILSAVGKKSVPQSNAARENCLQRYRAAKIAAETIKLYESVLQVSR